MADHKFGAKYIVHMEGGLSRAKTDSAHKNPCPAVHTAYDYALKRTVTANDWHTNKGITWAAFLSNASAGGYSPTYELFFSMPDEIWFTIFKVGYWDKLHADQIRSNVIATYAVSWIWGGGGINELKRFLKANNYKANTTQDVVFGLNNWSAVDESGLFNKMLSWRANYFKRLNQPANLKGWLNRLESYRKNLTPFLIK